MLTWSMTYKKRRIIAQLEQNPSLSITQRSYSKTCEKRQLSKRPKIGFNTNYRLVHVKSIAKCSKGAILQYFRTSLSYHLSLRSLFCLFLSGRFTQVLLYTRPYKRTARISARIALNKWIWIQEFYSTQNADFRLPRLIMIASLLYVLTLEMALTIKLERGTFICAHSWIFFKLCILITHYIRTMKMYLSN